MRMLFSFRSLIQFRLGIGLAVVTILVAAGLLAVPGQLSLTAPANAQAAVLKQVLSKEAEKAPEAATPAAPDSETTTAVTQNADASVEIYLDRISRAQDVFNDILKAAPGFPAAFQSAISAHDPEAGTGWVWTAVLNAIIAALLGLGALHLVDRMGRKQFAHFYEEELPHRADKISYLFLRAILMVFGLLAFVLVAGAVVLLLHGGVQISGRTSLVFLGVMALVLFVRIIFRTILAPGSPRLRLLKMSNGQAWGLYLSLVIGSAAVAVFLGFSLWMGLLGLPVRAQNLSLIVGSLVSTLILSGIAIAYRRGIGTIIRGEQGEDAPMWRDLLGRYWHVIAIAYFIIAWATTAVRMLLDLPSASGLVGAPIIGLIAAAAVYGLFILLIDKVLLPRLDTAKVQAGIAEDIRRLEESAGESEVDDPHSIDAQAFAEATDREAGRQPFRHLLDHGALLLAAFFGLSLAANSWGVSLTDRDSFFGGFLDVLLVVFLGYMAYRAVALAIDLQIAKESPDTGHDSETEIGGAGESRIATLLPIFRNFLLITIVVIAAMIVLSDLGVNIAPIFAGAGVVGLAVGFGAQTLIRDIFSGAFYLIDDAFRKGEYIDIGSAKGVVEKISIRSMQLRHHRGALTTIPFGEIQHVQNFSRDWALMKLAFRVTYDTDVEKMRKIIKKFGQQLMEDEEYGPMFLQPLKSQGIMSMEDSAMVARVKFMTKPGKQFILRKVIYAGLQDLFRENGIKFAHRQVTVHVASDNENAEDHPPAISEAAKAAAAGAAAQAMMADEEGNPEKQT
jgi:small-conductance mechanosensitive channel